MTESMIVEAVRAAGSANPGTFGTVAGATPTADPAAIARFQAAMAPAEPQGMPFVSEVASTWQASHDAYQARLRCVESLSAMRGGGHCAIQLMELQYDVAALAFQQEVVSNVAKKASDAVTTLVKNG